MYTGAQKNDSGHEEQGKVPTIYGGFEGNGQGESPQGTTAS
jgi:hypothetical protein